MKGIVSGSASCDIKLQLLHSPEVHRGSSTTMWCCPVP